MVSCLAVPDAFFNRGLYEEAHSEYDRIAVSHPGRDEGRLAGFRAGLCLLELGRKEDEGKGRGRLLGEAEQAFEGLKGDSCLAELGQAMVAGLRGDSTRKRIVLETAFREHPNDPHLLAVVEWVLGRLHSAVSDERLTLADIAVAPYVVRFEEERPGRMPPGTHDWWSRFTLRPAWRAAEIGSYEDDTARSAREAMADPA